MLHQHFRAVERKLREGTNVPPVDLVRPEIPDVNEECGDQNDGQRNHGSGSHH